MQSSRRDPRKPMSEGSHLRVRFSENRSKVRMRELRMLWFRCHSLPLTAELGEEGSCPYLYTLLGKIKLKKVRRTYALPFS